MSSTEQSSTIESNSLEYGKWGNLVMAIAGIGAAYLSRSDALLIDGLYSGVNFVSAIIAARVSVAVAKRPDRRFPFGYAVYEAIYVNFRSLVLLAIMGVAVFGASKKILTYITGGPIPELVYGPILIYTIVMVAICAALAFWHYFNWKKSGSRSQLLITESQAAVVDGVISGGAGGGLLAASLLAGTSLAFLIPIADSILVLAMTVFLVRQPLRMFWDSLQEIAGEATDSTDFDSLQSDFEELLTKESRELVEIVATKLGRNYFVVAYVNPLTPISATAIDEMNESLGDLAVKYLGGGLTAVIPTANRPFS